MEDYIDKLYIAHQQRTLYKINKIQNNLKCIEFMIIIKILQ